MWNIARFHEPAHFIFLGEDEEDLTDKEEDKNEDEPGKLQQSTRVHRA